MRMYLRVFVADSLRHAIDRKLFWVLVGITLLVAGAMLSIGFDGDRVTLFFGLVDVDAGGYSPVSALGRTQLVTLMVHGVMDVFLGWIGVTLAIIATAGLFPAMMESGLIDVVLSKPISRPLLFVYKYIASMVFVFIQAALFIVLTFLVMGLRWGVWEPGYLLAIPLMVLLFSYVYSVSVLTAVVSRSAVTAILVSLASWVLFSMVSQAPALFELYPSLKKHRTVERVVRVLSWIPPKTADVTLLAAKWARAGTSDDVVPSEVMETMSSEERAQVSRSREWEEAQMASSPVYSVGSSLLFEVAVVLLALWKFSRMDF
jgi:ABC-type transport system involved in multi-copper enzyme maturation permease subunit